MKRGRPISPSELKVIPPEVFDAVNELLVQNKPDLHGDRIILQRDFVRITKSKLDVGVKFDYDWLDFDEAYRKNGWETEYKKSSKKGNDDAFFRFTPERQ